MKYKDYFKDEIFAYNFYLLLSSRVKEAELKEKLKKMALMEKQHAEFWKTFLSPGEVKEDLSLFEKFKLNFYLILYHLFGLNFISHIIEIEEKSAIKEYYHLYKKRILDAQSQNTLRRIIEEELLHESLSKDMGGRADVTEHIRDIFLGMNDALVEISAALAGLISLYANNSFTIGITGTIIGMAGALSMSIGNYISVKNQKEVKDQDAFEKMVLRDLGKKVTIEEIKEDPLKAAYYTGIFYVLGTLIVVYPYYLGLNTYHAFIVSLSSASLAWIIGGAIIGLSSNISLKKKIMEMLFTGWGATALTYSLGWLLNRIAGVVM